MLLFVVAACMIPLLIQGRLMAQSSRQMQVERRIIDVQNQCQIRSFPCWPISSTAGSSL